MRLFMRGPCPALQPHLNTLVLSSLFLSQALLAPEGKVVRLFRLQNYYLEELSTQIQPPPGSHSYPLTSTWSK